MIGLRDVGLEEVVSMPGHGSRRHRTERAWRWYRRVGTGGRFRFQLRSVRSGDESDASLREREHLNYLKRMAEEGVVPPALATKAKLVWQVAQVSVGSDLPIPAAAALPGGPVEYHWSVGPHQLLAEIPADGPCHWTYRNATTGELWGVEIAVDEALSSRLIQVLTRITASSR